MLEDTCSYPLKAMDGHMYVMTANSNSRPVYTRMGPVVEADVKAGPGTHLTATIFKVDVPRVRFTARLRDEDEWEECMMRGRSQDLVKDIATYAGVAFSAPRPTAATLSREPAAKARAVFSADGAPCAKREFRIDGKAYVGNATWWKNDRMRLHISIDGNGKRVYEFCEEGRPWFKAPKVPATLESVGEKCQEWKDK